MKCILPHGIRFNRNEFAGAFGDIGTDLPLITMILLVSGIDTASVLILFGLMQVFSALVYGIPMPVQPLKAVAAIVIAEKLTGPVIYGAGLSIGLLMLLLTVTGGITWLARVIPKAVIRGIQFGLGIKLALLALGNYVQSEGLWGWSLAGIAFVFSILLLGNRKYPPALLLIGLGVIYAMVFKLDLITLPQKVGFAWPQWYFPEWKDLIQGFFLLAIPQIPLSLGNSIFATQQIAKDLFPEKQITVKKIGFTYSLMNLIVPFLSGIPVCHGSGGMAGHYMFGGRTGGSVIIYGGLYLGLGLLFSQHFADIVQVFPLPILGVILFFEGLLLMRFIADLMRSKTDLSIALLVGVIAVGLPYGFLIAMLVGTFLHYASLKFSLGFHSCFETDTLPPPDTP
ncbi:putative sulfate/molybdate transporter [Deltaproteobacteria bacterium TL4]